MHTSSSRTIATLAKYTQSRRARAHTLLGAYATINQPITHQLFMTSSIIHDVVIRFRYHHIL